MLLKTYIDDSADQKQQEVVVAGSFIGGFGQWSRLKPKWNRTLRRENVSPFRSTEYYSLRGQFEKYRDPIAYPKPKGSDAARNLRDQLESIVIEAKVVGWAVCVSIPIWNKVRDGDPYGHQILTDPFEIAIQLLMAELSRSVTKLLGRGQKLAFVADESNSSERIEKVYLQFKRINPTFENIQGFTHLDDKTVPPLQVADMMASIAKECYQEHLRTGKEVVPRRLRETIMAIQVPDEEYLAFLVEHDKKSRGLV